MTKFNPYNTLCLIATLALLFTVGNHLGGESAEMNVGELYVTVKVGKISGDAESTKEILIDGKYDCTATVLGDTVTFVCRGSETESGFLISGAKYIALNQPLRASGEGFYVEGRITDVSKSRVSIGEG